MKVKYFFKVTSCENSFRVHFVCGGYDGNLFIHNDPHIAIGSVTYFPQVDLWEFSHDAEPDCTFVGVTREDAVEAFLEYVFSNYRKV